MWVTSSLQKHLLIVVLGTENAYLRAWFRSQRAEVSAVGKFWGVSFSHGACADAPCLVLPGRQDMNIEFSQSLASSPRRSQLHDVGYRTIGNGKTSS